MSSVAAPCLNKGVEVLHAVAGRVRLRALDSVNGDTLRILKQQLWQLEGVRKVQTDGKTGSLRITFDDDQLSLLQLFEALQNSQKSATSLGREDLAQQPVVVPYKVVQANPGRVRFRVPRLAEDAEYTQRLHILLAADKQVSAFRLRRAAASLVVYYLPQTIDAQIHSHLVQLIQQANEVVKLRQLKEVDHQQGNAWSGLRLPVLATALSLLAGPLGWSISSLMVGGSIAVAALPVARRTLESIFYEGKLNSDFLDLTAIAIITAQSHFLTSSSMIVLIELGEAIRDNTARSSQSQSLDLLSSLGQFAWVEREGEKRQVPIEQVQPEDTVIVYPGEQIPVDGHILRGKALIDEQKLTGESIPVVRSQGEAVYASTLVREGAIYILAERLGADTRAGRTVALIENAPVHDTRIENYAAKIADRAVLPTLMLGGAVLAATGNVARTASVLTIDFATGIRVSVPTTVMAALLQATRRGILIRSGRALEKLAQVDAVVFDKTGTLTQGDVRIIGVKTVDPSISEQRLLSLAATAEQRITHPVAQAVMSYASSQGVEVLHRGDWDYQVGFGLLAEIEEQIILVGSERFLVQEGVSLEPLYENHPELRKAEHPTIYVASNGYIQGALQYTDPLRSESQEVITALRRGIGAEIHLLTGDNQERANLVARELEIESSNIHANAFPEYKAEIVQKLHNQGKTVAFVGDGLNDSAALVYADVSVSFRDGSDIARETAEVVLMKNDLHGLVEAIAIAQHAQQTIRQNTTIVAVPNLSGLAMAATVGLSPMLATLLNNGSSVIAGINGLQPLLAGKRKQEINNSRVMKV